MNIRRMTALALTAMLVFGACSGDDGGSGSQASATAERDDSSANGDSGSNDDSDNRSSEGGNAAVQDAEDCTALVDAATPVFTGLFQQLVDDTQDMSVADLASLGDDVEGSQVFRDWIEDVETEGAAIEAKSGELGCSDADAEQALCQAVDGVTADNDIARAMIEEMASSGGCA